MQKEELRRTLINEKGRGKECKVRIRSYAG
jgi:hypothetical protein